MQKNIYLAQSFSRDKKSYLKKFLGGGVIFKNLIYSIVSQGGTPRFLGGTPRF
jgi:hypothetical protein